MALLTLNEPENYLLYRDAMMLVINKPAGHSVQPGKGQSKNLVPLYDRLRFGLPNSPAPAHRLDAPTSGCLILGRHRQASIKLGKLFEHNKIKKTYVALLLGDLPHESGEINLPIGKMHDRKDNWLMKIDPEFGQESITKYQVLKQFKGMSLVSLEPITGRTHQLRVHCAAMNAPIYGDWIYGEDRDIDVGLCLHASSVDVPLYTSKPNIIVEAPLPEHMIQIISEHEHSKP